MSEYDNGYRQSGYQSVFARLSITDTESSALKKTSPRGKNSYRNQSPGYSPSMNSGTSSPRLVSPKIFDRLANTETYATASMKGKIGNQRRSKSTPRKTSNAFFERMAYTETFASAKLKGLIDTSPKKRNISRGRSVQSTRSGTRGSDFWDRMSKTETYASASMKGKYRKESPAPAPVRRGASRSTSNGRVTRTTLSFFDRLFRADTASSLQKKKSLAGSQVSTPDSARSYHRRSPTAYSVSSNRPKPKRSYLRKAKSPSRGSPSYESKKHVYDSNKSVGSIRSARSSYTATSARSGNTARTGYHSVATTRSATTSRSLASSIGKSVTTTKLKPKPKAIRPSYASHNTSRIGFPPPSPKVRAAPRTIFKSPSPRSSPRNIPRSSPKRMQRNAPRPTSTRSITESAANLTGRPNTPSAIKEFKKPQPEAPRPPPPPRPVLQFDDDDELSFGSEESDEASLGPSSVKAPPQDAGSIASKKSSVSTSISNNAAAAALTVDTNVVMGKGPAVSVSMERSFMTAREDEDTDEEVHERPEAIEVEMQEIPEVGGEAEANVEVEVEYEAEAENDTSHEQKIQEMDDKSEASGGSEHIDDFLNDLDTTGMDENEPQDDSGPLTKDETSPRIPLVHESDDELSFGSDEGDDDDWLGASTRDTAKDDEQNADAEAGLAAKKSDDEDELGDFLNSSAESSSQDMQGTPDALVLDRSFQDEALDAGDVDERDDHSTKLTENDEVKSQSDGGSLHEAQPDDDDNESVEVDDNDGVSDADDVSMFEEDDFNKEDELEEDDSMHSVENEDDVDIDGFEEDHYDEDEDLDQMDSLDLILDATKSSEPRGLSAEKEIEDEDLEEDEQFSMNGEVNEVEESQCRYKILKSEKYHPEYGFEEIDPDDLYLKETLEAFEDGDISNEEIAVLIIEALFERDFDNGEHWEIDAGTARELEEDEGGGGDLEDLAFVVKRQARLDWNDLYSVAASKGTIFIDPEKSEIRVENYSYFVAG